MSDQTSSLSQRRVLRTTTAPPSFQIDHSKMIESTESWPEDATDVVPFGRFLETDTEAHAGVRVAAGDDVTQLQSFLSRVEKIEIAFEKYSDGRGYTQAKILRAQLGYTGEIRAVGDVGVDQVHYLREVGFDAFELRPNTSEEAALRALQRITVNYRDPQTRRGASA